MSLEAIIYHPLFGVSSTLLVFMFFFSLQRRFNWLHPILFSSATLITFLLVFDIPYEAYKVGGDYLTFFLAPATVALAVPMYKQLAYIKRYFWSICVGVTSGSLSALASAWFFVWLCQGSQEILLSILPKSVTTPISMEIARSLGGIPELAALFTVLTGIVGSIFGPFLLRLCGVYQDIPIGVAMGTTAHGIGTARLFRDSELQGSVSGLSMALAGIITSFLVIPLYFLF